ncbi:hypothetical protein FH972_021201 [Carpinus fangiana]|uniref:Aminoacyl-transfer RNA synthetases class-II family profile domain-containing protein n=1 Tax=Carpinus fangiana TaxID=176857 RepID=A0A5N6KNU7_9ROSI|nr:hypothetical protein FH972_021201 [Carpinus fangiana]
MRLRAGKCGGEGARRHNAGGRMQTMEWRVSPGPVVSRGWRGRESCWWCARSRLGGRRGGEKKCNAGAGRHHGGTGHGTPPWCHSPLFRARSTCDQSLPYCPCLAPASFLRAGNWPCPRAIRTATPVLFCQSVCFMHQLRRVGAVRSSLRRCGLRRDHHLLPLHHAQAQRVISAAHKHVASLPFACAAGLHTSRRHCVGATSNPAVDALAAYKQTFNVPPPSHNVSDLSLDDVGQEVVLYGYINTVRVMSKKLVFADLLAQDLGSSVQLVSVTVPPQSGVEFRDLAAQTPVAVRGVVKQKKEKPTTASHETAAQAEVQRLEHVEVQLSDFHVLNHFPTDIKFSEMSTFGPEQRHLQIRHSKSIRDALAFRSTLASFCRRYLEDEHNFVEVETPLLFKSTPEGAREFLVPTRTPGHAYALPQSPQQYKQILMASGIPRYFQIARCFRDEDLRADRQPEFTQLDLEMAFARGSDVMLIIEKLVKRIWHQMMDIELAEEAFPRMSYHEAMSRFGSDKPDTRLGMEIARIGHMLPVDLVSKIGPLTDPIVEGFKFALSEAPNDTRNFVSDFMSSPEAGPFISNPDGQPGIFIFDPRKPLSGLSPFGFEAAEYLEEHLNLAEGDMVVIQARKNELFSGGSTPLGALRLALHRAAVSKGLLPEATGWNFLWINEFPLFSPTNDTDPGQGGAAGIASTHHPFTAPLSPADVDLLASDPLAVTAEHYDLVLNGVEIGGGSKRIHHHKMQEFILKDVLKMSEDRMQHFGHLLEVLRAGCPPHAGIALGFDRLCAIMRGTDSIRDVIAFPKDGRGKDALVGSPSSLTESQLNTYHLKLANRK